MQSLVGSWKLVSLYVESSSGEQVHPFGEQPSGMVIYTAEGMMSVVVMRQERPKFASGDSFNGTAEEMRAAFEGCDAYCGRYSVDWDQPIVTHHVEVSRFPNWEGLNMTRHIDLTGDNLHLYSASTRILGKDQIIHAFWKRQT